MHIIEFWIVYNQGGISMGAKRKQYKITGRYLNKREVVGYHMEDLDTNKSGRFSRDQVAFLVGRGQVINCEAQIYKDKVLYRGIGCCLDDLPSKQINDGTEAIN